MFRRLRQRLRDMNTISKLCSGAERHALQGGEKEPGAEHFLLAAIDLPDGSARRAFERLHANPDDFKSAIARQYVDALRHAGVDVERLEALGGEPAPASPGRSLFKTKASGQALMQELAAQRASDKEGPLLGAHVVAVIAGMERGVAARSLKQMGVDLPALGAAAREEMGKVAG